MANYCFYCILSLGAMVSAWVQKRAHPTELRCEVHFLQIPTWLDVKAVVF